MRQGLSGGLAALLGLGLGACEAGDAREPPTEALGRSRSALQGTLLGYDGRDDTVDLPIANMVVQLNDGHSLCSGAMISPLLV